MLVSEEVQQKYFTDKTIKDAYLTACKWISTNFIAKGNSNNITYKINKVSTQFGEPKKVVVTIYVTIDEGEVFEQNCEVCKEANSLFYLNSARHDCDSCKIIPYRKRIKNKIKIIKESMRRAFI